VVKNSATSIDHIFVKNFEIDNINPVILKCDITDHFAIININYGKINASHTKNNLKQYTKIDFDLLNNKLKNDNWSCLSNISDVDTLIDIFNNTLNLYNNCSSTVKLVHVNSKKICKLKEWMTRGLVASIRHKEKLSFNLKKSLFNIVLKKTFSIYRDLLNMLIRKATEIYYFDKIQNASKSSKKMWEIINDVTGKHKNKNVHINNILGTDSLIKNENVDIGN